MTQLHKMDHLSMQTNYQRELNELEPKMIFLRKPCTCEKYPYYHAISASKAFCDKINKQLYEASKKEALLKICTKNTTNPCSCEKINKQLTEAVFCGICCEVCREEAAATAITAAEIFEGKKSTDN